MRFQEKGLTVKGLFNRMNILGIRVCVKLVQFFYFELILMFLLNMCLKKINDDFIVWFQKKLKINFT